MGTWKLNEAKSKLAPGTTKDHTVIYSAAGDNTKITVDGVDAAGKEVHSEWTGKFDAKYYPVIGDPTSDTRSYRQINLRTLSFTAKQGSRVTLSGRVVVSKSSKTRTVTTTAKFTIFSLRILCVSVKRESTPRRIERRLTQSVLE